MEFGVGRGVGEGIGHGHGGHEVGDLFGLEGELVVRRVESHNGAVDVVGLGSGRWGRRGVAAGKCGGEEDELAGVRAVHGRASVWMINVAW